jgi:hypothetical protein
VLAEGLVLQPRTAGELAAGDVDLDALVAQDAQPAPRRLLARVVAGDDDAAMPASRIASVHGRLLALVAARLERDVERGAATSASPAAASASTSACGPPNSACQPSPSTSSSLTTTAPTSGFGLTRRRRDRRARWRRGGGVVGLGALQGLHGY